MGARLINDYQSVLDDTPLRQGDIIEWIHDRKESTIRDPQKKFAVVVTADCDLDKDKTGGKISYVPALVAEDYVWLTWRPKKFHKARTDNIKKLQTRISRIRKKEDPGLADLSDDAVSSWVDRCGLKILDEIGVTDPGQKSDFSRLVNTEIELSKLLSRNEPSIDCLLKCFCLVRKESEESPGEALEKEIKNAISSLPGDVFYISSSHKMAPGGMFCLLRSITQCERSEIALRPGDIRSGTASGKRIGNLNSPFRFALMQNLAKVFTDIGLPDDYSERVKMSPSMLISAKVKK